MAQEVSIKEARRYIANAKQTLSEKAGKNGDFYSDSKYVRTAGDVAWKGVLMALDTVFSVKTEKHKRVSISDYLAVVGKRNRKMLDKVDTGYEILHLFMGYDGTRSYKICKMGLDLAEEIIDWCETNHKTTA